MALHAGAPAYATERTDLEDTYSRSFTARQAASMAALT